ncbi:MAG TPA: hypothetical protein VIV61_15775 [Candidatus Ozemobacteraceae bacterium]
MKHDDTTTPAPVAHRTTTTRTPTGTLIYCRDLFEKDLYRNHMPQVRGEALQLATPLRPSPSAITPTVATAKRPRGTNPRP